ncbi:hypothetical protein N7490_004560 [Penicillium lividum]|nr:hypothetical protein N7490_004560 [Penicillium lividum]
MLPLMIRRPPSIIFLGDEELRYYLRRTFLRSLSIDFGRLNLNDQDRNYGYERDNLFDPSSSGESSDDSDEDVDAKQSRVVQSSSVGTRSAPGVITSPVEESALTESAHQTVDTINAPATRLGLSLSSQTRVSKPPGLR